MLINADRSGRRYRIILNNATNGAEVMADLSYLVGAPSGDLNFDFTHMAAQLTQEQREGYLPGNLGYQPTRQLVEVIAAIGICAADRTTYPHCLQASLPDTDSRVGNFLRRMELREILERLGLTVSFDKLANLEMGSEDDTRQNLIPLTSINLDPDGRPDFTQLRAIRQRVQRVFGSALPGNQALAGAFAGVVSEAIDNAVEYGQGGILGGLFYPRAGEVEITLVNREGGFGGLSVTQELEALIDACEGHSKREFGGGNGIAELSRLTIECFGTLVLRNGGATLFLLPDGSVTAVVDDYGLRTPGAAVTILLQLSPTNAPAPTPALDSYTRVLQDSLVRFGRLR